MQPGFSLILIHIYVSLSHSETKKKQQLRNGIPVSNKHDTDHQYSFNSELYPGDFSLKGIKRS